MNQVIDGNVLTNQMINTQNDENAKIMEVTKSRRHDIDWLRVLLFALLIWFHYAVFSLGQIDIRSFNLPLFFTIGVMHQWRLAALFVISGMGTAFAFRRRDWKRYIKERVIRLGIPLLFGTYILWMGIFTPIDTTIRLFKIFPGTDEMPYGHLWFIYNLLIYSIILTPLFTHVRNNPNGNFVNFVKKIIGTKYGFGILIVPPFILFFNAVLFKPWAFGEVGMWWEFPRYLLYFLFGYLLICAKDEYFSIIDRIRLPVTIFAPLFSIAWYILKEGSQIPLIMEGGWVNHGFPAFSFETVIATMVQTFHAWFWCLLIFSWASKLLNKPSKWLAYLNEAVYPTYIVHMHLTFFPIALFGLFGLNYYIGLSIGTILVMIGVLICFEIVRRTQLARPLFGIKGGLNEIKNIFPYNKTNDQTRTILFSIIFHFATIGMVIALIILLIGSGILSEM